MPSAMELFGESSDDDDDEEEETIKRPGVTTTPDKDGNKKGESDKEGDAEFDGQVVGLSSKTLAGAKSKDGENADEEAPRSKPPPKTVHQSKLRVPVTTTLAPHVSVHVTKLPNLMGIQPQPFDTSTYLPSVEDEEFGPSAASLVRWRYANKDDKGDDAPMESNTRLVEWEDGSWTLHIGAEAFEVELKDRSKKDFPGFNGYLFQSHQAQVDGKEDQTVTVLECVAPVNSRLTVHPSSLQSAAHKSLTVAVRQKTLKQARIATVATQDDPELLKAKRIQASQDIHKQKQKSGGGGRSGGGRRARYSRGYMEDDDDDGAFQTTNLRGLKRKVRDGEDLDDFIDDDEDEEEDMGRASLRAAKRNRRQRQQEPEEEEEEEEELVLGGDDDDDDDDDEEEAAPRLKKNNKKPARSNVFDEDDEDDDDD